MKIIRKENGDPIEQGTEAWFQARIGIPTASELHRIITPSKGALSKQHRNYLARLVAERLLNRTMDSMETSSRMDHGKEMEPKAAQHYWLETGREIERIGFATTDDGRVGCSPDYLLSGLNVPLEIKCPAAHTHTFYKLFGPGDDYKPQVQGQILVMGVDRAEFYSWDMELPSVLIPTAADYEYLDNMRGALSEFCDEIDRAHEACKSWGYFAARAKVQTPFDQTREDTPHYKPDPRPAAPPALGPGRTWAILSATGAEAQAPDGAAWKGWWDSEIARLIGRRSLIRLRLLVDSNAKLFEAIERQGRGEAAIVSEVRANCDAGIAALATGDQRGTR